MELVADSTDAETSLSGNASFIPLEIFVFCPLTFSCALATSSRAEAAFLLLSVIFSTCLTAPLVLPTAYKKKMKLSTCKYHFADLIKDNYSGIEIALDNNEVRALFKKVSIETDLSQYTQYIAIPLYCKSGKLLGIFQIVTKNGYIIEDSKVKMEKFITDNIIPLSNLIILTDKIYKGLYITPTNINEEE